MEGKEQEKMKLYISILSVIFYFSLWPLDGIVLPVKAISIQ